MVSNLCILLLITELLSELWKPTLFPIKYLNDDSAAHCSVWKKYHFSSFFVVVQALVPKRAANAPTWIRNIVIPWVFQTVRKRWLYVIDARQWWFDAAYDGVCIFQNLKQMCHVMRKPVFAIWEQQRCRSACTSAQSDQRLCCSLPR